MSAQREGDGRGRSVPLHCSGTTKTCSKFTHTTRNGAASATVAECSSAETTLREQVTDRMAPGVVRNARRSPALIVCQVLAPRNLPRSAAMAQRPQSAPDNLEKGKFLQHGPSPRHAGERHHHPLFRLGDQLPGTQGHRRLAVERSVALHEKFSRQSRRIASVEAAE
jgi:hypothetical protein